MKNKIKNVLKYFQYIDLIDIYGQQINLKFRKESDFKTKFGGLITFLVGILTGLWTVVTIYQIVQSSITSIIYQEILMEKSDINSIQFNPHLQDAFQIGLFNQQNNQSLNSSNFEIFAYYFQECDLVDNKVEVNSKRFGYNIQLKECSKLQNTNTEYQFINNKNFGYYCFDQVEGSYPQISQSINCQVSINLIVQKKQNINNKQKIEFDEQSKISIAIPQNLINERDVDTPFHRTSIMRSFDVLQEQQIQNINIQQKSLISVNLKKIIMNDSKDLSLGPNKSITSFVVDSIQDKAMFNVLSEIEKAELINHVSEDDILFKVKISFSQNNSFLKINRYYQSIPSILGTLGGGIKILVLMGFLVVSPFARLQFQKTMLNEVFNFENAEEIEEIQEVEQVQQMAYPSYLVDQNQPTLKSIDEKKGQVKRNSLFYSLHSEQINEQNSPTKKNSTKQLSQKKILFSQDNQQNQQSNQQQQNQQSSNQLKVTTQNNKRSRLSVHSAANQKNNEQMSSSVSSIINNQNINNANSNTNNNINTNQNNNNIMNTNLNQNQNQISNNNNNVNNIVNKINNTINNKNIRNLNLQINIEKPIKQNITRTTHKSKSINPSYKSFNFGQDLNNNNEENGLQSFQKYGNKKNVLRDIIKETILMNSQRYLSESKQDLDQNVQQSTIEKQRPSLQMKLQEQQKQIKKNQKNQKKAEDQVFQKVFKTTYNPLKFSFLESIFYYIWPFGRFRRTKQQMSYSIEKLDHHLDSIYIIKKLLEVDKLKMLLLDEDQIKLLEYLPKPTINLNKMQVEMEEMSNQSSQNIKGNSDQLKFNILYQDTRNDLTKATQAFEAFQTIKSKHTLSKIDKRLIELLDPKIAHYFNLDDGQVNIKSNTMQNNQSSIENDNRQQFQNDCSISYSQKCIKNDNKSISCIQSLNSPIVISPLSRSASKKASMFKQPAIQNRNQKRDSLSITLNSAGLDINKSGQIERYDEIEEEQQLNNYNQNYKSKKSIEKSTPEGVGSKQILNRLRSRSNDDAMSQSQYKSRETITFSNQQSPQTPSTNKNQFLINQIMTSQSGSGGKPFFQTENQRIDSFFGGIDNILQNNQSEKLLQETMQSFYSNNMIADESIQLHSLDFNKIFQLQNKFSNIVNPTYSTIIRQRSISINNQMTSQINHNNISENLQLKPNIEEENKQI